MCIIYIERKMNNICISVFLSVPRKGAGDHSHHKKTTHRAIAHHQYRNDGTDRDSSVHHNIHDNMTSTSVTWQDTMRSMCGNTASTNSSCNMRHKTSATLPVWVYGLSEFLVSSVSSFAKSLTSNAKKELFAYEPPSFLSLSMI